jgi:glycosyltransferase involved in cell wall biosynthesis
MHLLIVSPFPPAITGIGQYGYHVTRALAQSGMFSHITVLAGSRIIGEHPNHLGTTELEYCWAPGQWQARTAILSRVKRLNPDLVWFNVGASIFGKSPWVNISGLLTPMFIQKLGFPTVVTLHELIELADLRALDAPGGPFAKAGARLLTNLVTQADVLCLTMRHYADWLKQRRVDCAYIPIGAYHEPDLLEESDSQELLFFTTLAPFKGLELLLEAFYLLRKEYPKLKLTIAGTAHMRFPNYAHELKTRFTDMAGITWLGQTSEDDILELFRRSQIVVLPYSASTGSSSVLYQAATWGRPVVVSNLGEIKKLAAESNLEVEFFDSGNTQSLCEALRKLIDSKESRCMQVKHNFQAIQHTRPQETCRKYIQAFNRALEKRSSPKRIASPLVEQKPA